MRTTGSIIFRSWNQLNQPAGRCASKKGELEDKSKLRQQSWSSPFDERAWNTCFSRCFWRVVSSAQMKAMLSFSWNFVLHKNGRFHRRCRYKEQQLTGVLCFVAVAVLNYEFLSMKQRRMNQFVLGCCKEPVERPSLAFVSPPTQTEIGVLCKTSPYLKASNFPQNGFMEGSDFCKQKMFSLQGQSMSVPTMCVCVCVLEISIVHKPSAPFVILNIFDSDCLVWFTKPPTVMNLRHCWNWSVYLFNVNLKGD